MNTSRLNRYEALCQSLLARISQGEWTVGTRLPTETQLAQTYAVSRATVTKAIAKLQSLGLIRSRQGDGTYVEAILPRASGMFVSAVLTSPLDLRHLMEFRTILEREIGRLAVERAADNDVEALEATVARMRQSLHDHQRFVDADVAFHLMLAGMTGNELLADVYRRAQDLLRSQMLIGAEHPEAMLRAVEAHERIVRGLRMRASDLVVAAITVHLHDAIEEVAGALDAGRGTDGATGLAADSRQASS